MKSLILLISITLFNIQTLISQDCEYKRKEVDETTNDKILETKVIPLVMELTSSMDISIVKAGHQYSLNIIYNNTDFTIINNGDALLFKLNNDSIIILKNQENAITDVSNKILLSYPIKEAELLSIAKTGIKKLRIYAQKGYADHEIKPVRNENFVHLVKCILKN